MELNLLVGIPVVCLWDKTWKPLGDGVGVGVKETKVGIKP